MDGPSLNVHPDKEFTIRSIGDCLARGYDRTGFEVDTGEQRTWTVQLTESSEQPKQSPAPPGPVSSNPLATSGGASPVIGTPAIALGRAGSTAPLGARTQ